jgi:hypothetical protein
LRVHTFILSFETTDYQAEKLIGPEKPVRFNFNTSSKLPVPLLLDTRRSTRGLRLEQHSPKTLAVPKPEPRHPKKTCVPLRNLRLKKPSSAKTN